MQTKGIEDFARVTDNDVRAFIAVRRRDGLAASSIQRLLSSLRNFYKYLIKEGLAQFNPVLDIRAPRGAKKLPKALDVDQVAQMLNRDPESPLEKRDFAMMELMYSSGLRLTELVMLDMKDIDLAAAQVKVLGKGNKTRYVPVGQQACAALKQWFAAREKLVAVR